MFSPTKYISFGICDIESTRYEFVVLKAIEENGLAINYASYRLRNTKYIVLEAVNQNSIMFAFDKLKNIS